MSEQKTPTLPGEATAAMKVEELLSSASAKAFIAEYIDGGQTGVDRFKQLVHGIGYAMFQDGLHRVGYTQESMTIEHQAALLQAQTDMFLRGASELSDHIRGEY